MRRSSIFDLGFAETEQAKCRFAIQHVFLDFFLPPRLCWWLGGALRRYVEQARLRYPTPYPFLQQLRTFRFSFFCLPPGFPNPQYPLGHPPPPPTSKSEHRPHPTSPPPPKAEHPPHPTPPQGGNQQPRPAFKWGPVSKRECSQFAKCSTVGYKKLFAWAQIFSL